MAGPLLLIYFLLLLIPLLTVYLHLKMSLLGRSKLPPGPRPLPIIGSLHLLGDLPHRSLRRLAGIHGPIMHLRLGSVPTVVASSAAAAAEFLKTHDLSFCDRPPIVALQKFSYGGVDIASSNYNEKWRHAKKIAALELFNHNQVLNAFRSLREEEVTVLVEDIAARSSSGKGIVKIGEMVTCLFNNIICREIFGRRMSEDGGCGRSKYQDMILEVIYLMGGFSVGDFFPGMEWVDRYFSRWGAKLDFNFKVMDEFLEEEIKAHATLAAESSRVGELTDFCTTLLRLQKDGVPLTTSQIKGIMMNMFLGGTETAASTVEWGMAELVRNVRVMKKAQDEVRNLVGAKGKVEEGDLSQLHYLKLVVKEVFRMHPLSLLPRRCREECVVDGYVIPVNTTVYVNAWAIGRDPQSWKDPDVFHPERFDGSLIDYKGKHLELLPFGAGRRMCPGFTLGVIGVELALANLLYSFEWELPEGGYDVNMDESYGLAIHMKTPLALKATPVII